MILYMRLTTGDLLLLWNNCEAGRDDDDERRMCGRGGVKRRADSNDAEAINSKSIVRQRVEGEWVGIDRLKVSAGGV